MSKKAYNPSQTEKMHIRRNDIAQLFKNIYMRIFYTFRLSSVSQIQDAKYINARPVASEFEHPIIRL